MKRYLIKVSVGPYDELLTLIVWAFSQPEAQRKALDAVRMRVQARVVGERRGPKEEDHLIADIIAS